MDDSYLNGDYLIINELSIKVLQEELMRGEVIVFKYPKDPKQYFIKRVIGLPNETIEIKDGYVTIYNENNPNGATLDESAYLRPGTKTTSNRGIFKVTLKEDEYFVLGDNRAQSLDSRIFGTLPYENIIGITWIRGFPFNRVDIFEAPEYDF
jgi:signal peptidase I